MIQVVCVYGLCILCMCHACVCVCYTVIVFCIMYGRTGYALHGHCSGVQAVVVLKERFVISASDDYDLRVWDFGASGLCLPSPFLRPPPSAPPLTGAAAITGTRV